MLSLTPVEEGLSPTCHAAAPDLQGGPLREENPNRVAEIRESHTEDREPSDAKRCDFGEADMIRTPTAIQSRLGCRHYARSCKLVAPCCGQIVWCRHCHDHLANTVHGVTDINKFHEMDRSRVTEIVCGLCDTRQPIGSHCSSCGTRFASYFCRVCKFWDDDGRKKQIFHCDECQICRIGGRENFFHCKTCATCYSIDLRNNHTCIEQATRTACPICLEFMFTSVRPVAKLRCGHTIHRDCLIRMVRDHRGLSSIRCPLCLQSFSEQRSLWSRVDQAVADIEIPPDQVYALCPNLHSKDNVDAKSRRGAMIVIRRVTRRSIFMVGFRLPRNTANLLPFVAPLSFRVEVPTVRIVQYNRAFWMTSCQENSQSEASSE